MFPLPARPSGPPARAPFWRSSRRTAALALALLLALLAAGEGAAQDGAAPEEVLPPATDLRLEPAEVRRRLSHHLLRAGYRDVTQDEERARLRAWLPAREEELRSAIRNAHYTLVGAPSTRRRPSKAPSAPVSSPSRTRGRGSTRPRTARASRAARSGSLC